MRPSARMGRRVESIDLRQIQIEQDEGRQRSGVPARMCSSFDRQNHLDQGEPPPGRFRKRAIGSRATIDHRFDPDSAL